MKLTKLLIPTLLLSVPFALAQQVTPPPSTETPDSELVGNPAEPGIPEDVPLEAQYNCSVLFDNTVSSIPFGMTERLSLPSTPRSLIERLYNGIVRTFNRESFL